MQKEYVSAADALQKLKEGNAAYLHAKTGAGDISCEKRFETSRNGQKPYAVIVGCSDSRVIPECIFSAGIGELFVIRVAGNVIDAHQLGSIEYAVGHLGCRLVLVLGHTGCGAVAAAAGQTEGYIKRIADEIKYAIGEERDGVRASMLNVKHSVAKIKELLPKWSDVQVTGALYDTESGLVDFEI